MGYNIWRTYVTHFYFNILKIGRRVSVAGSTDPRNCFETCFIVRKSFLLFVSVRFHGIRLNRKTRERTLRCRGYPLFPFGRSRKKRHELESSIGSKQLRSTSIRFEANTWLEFRDMRRVYLLISLIHPCTNDLPSLNELISFLAKRRSASKES